MIVWKAPFSKDFLNLAGNPMLSKALLNALF